MLWVLSALTLSAIIGPKDGLVIFVVVGLFLPAIIWGFVWVLAGFNSKKYKMLIFSIFLFIGCVIGISYLVKNNLIYSISSEKAILNATWGMSPNEVEKANNAVLSRHELHNIFILVTPDVSEKNRFKFLVQKNRFLFGREAEISYDFFDNKLYRYVVSLNINNKGKAENNILGVIRSKHGDGQKTKKTSDDELCSYKWITKKQIVSYSLYKNKKNEGYKVIIRAIFIPLDKEIKEIAKDEKASYF